MSAEVVNCYLHENYLAFIEEIEELEIVSEYGSIADLLVKRVKFSLVIES